MLMFEDARRNGLFGNSFKSLGGNWNLFFSCRLSLVVRVPEGIMRELVWRNILESYILEKVMV